MTSTTKNILNVAVFAVFGVIAARFRPPKYTALDRMEINQKYYQELLRARKELRQNP